MFAIAQEAQKEVRDMNRKDREKQRKKSQQSKAQAKPTLTREEVARLAESKEGWARLPAAALPFALLTRMSAGLAQNDEPRSVAVYPVAEHQVAAALALITLGVVGSGPNEGLGRCVFFPANAKPSEEASLVPAETLRQQVAQLADAFWECFAEGWLKITGTRPADLAVELDTRATALVNSSISTPNSRMLGVRLTPQQ